MTKQQSDSFAQQQSGEAAYIRGMDRDKKQQSAEDTVLGNASDLANDPYSETDGVPKKTQAQDDAEHGRRPVGRLLSQKPNSFRERAALEEQHRRQNDLDSLPVSLDFSDYFEKEKTPASATAPPAATPGVDPEAAALEAKAAAVAKQHRLPLTDPESEQEPSELQTASIRKEARDPQDDYSFDSSSGKFYRLMEAP